MDVLSLLLKTEVSQESSSVTKMAAVKSFGFKNETTEARSSLVFR